MKIALNNPVYRLTDKQIVLVYYFAVVVLLILFLFSALMGMIDYEITEYKMTQQVFHDKVAVYLTRFNIGFQFMAAVGLIYMLLADNPMIYGLILPLAMLSIYTFYSLLAVMEAFGYEPCTCINLFKNTTWLEGSLINMSFLGISIISVLIYKKKGGTLSEAQK